MAECNHLVALDDSDFDSGAILYYQNEMDADIAKFGCGNVWPSIPANDFNRNTDDGRFRFCPVCGHSIDWARYDSAHAQGRVVAEAVAAARTAQAAALAEQRDWEEYRRLSDKYGG